MRLSISTKYWSTDNRMRLFCLLRVVVGPESVCLDSPDNQKFGLLTAFLVSSLEWKNGAMNGMEERKDGTKGPRPLTSHHLPSPITYLH